MKAFISYSLNDSEQYILTILSRVLKEQGYSITSNHLAYKHVVNYEVYTQLGKSNLFIGIITKTGNANTRVLNEWKEAIKRKIPAIILIEDNVKVNGVLKEHPNALFFNRYTPDVAIRIIKSKISPKTPYTSKKVNNTAAWVLGGLAALAIIGLLAKEK